MAFWIWFSGILFMVVVPWTLKGIADFFSSGPRKKTSKSDLEKWCDLLTFHLAPTPLVISGILFLNAGGSFGIYPSLPGIAYLVAPLLGASTLLWGFLFSNLLARLMARFSPSLLSSEMDRYSSNVGNTIASMSLPYGTAISVANGFGEEAVMRVLIIGGLSFYSGVPLVISCLLSLMLNGIHHAYQGRVYGVLGSMFVGLFYVVAYVWTRDFLFIALAHVGNDFVGVLLSRKLHNSAKAETRASA